MTKKVRLQTWIEVTFPFKVHVRAVLVTRRGLCCHDREIGIEVRVGDEPMPDESPQIVTQNEVK